MAKATKASTPSKPPKAFKSDPKLDLVLERTVDVPRELIWRCWTEPRHLMKWFTPAPWRTIACKIDLRPGGVFATTMLSPEGEEFPSAGCFLDVVPHQRLVFTDALKPGFRPGEQPFMTAIITLKAKGKKTLYNATVLHSSAENRQKHEEMGFHAGWGKALDQLVEHAGTM